jgi:hypothetical protein
MPGADRARERRRTLERDQARKQKHELPQDVCAAIRAARLAAEEIGAANKQRTTLRLKREPK